MSGTPAIISDAEAAVAKRRAIYARLKITNPEAADAMLKEHIKARLLAASEPGRGPVKILPLSPDLYL